MTFWIALLPWFWLSVLGIDSDARCYEWETGFELFNLRVTVGMHTAYLAHTLLGNILGWLPVLLMFFIGLLDYNNFGDVLVFWCMAGLASLIILLTLKIGSRKSTNSLPEETLQQLQASRGR